MLQCPIAGDATGRGMSCLSVCMYVSRTITFESFDVGFLKSIFAQPVHLRGMRVKFVYEGHRVNVKVTGAKKAKIPIVPQFKTSIAHNLGSITHKATRFACVMGFLPRCMECRRGLAMRILSVCLSVTRVHCDKTVERSVKIYIPYERSFSLVF